MIVNTLMNKTVIVHCHIFIKLKDVPELKKMIKGHKNAINEDILLKDYLNYFFVKLR